MLGWNSGFNWTHDELKDVIHQLFDVEKRTSGTLDVEHSDAKNMKDIIRWCEEMGYKAAEASGGDIIRVWIPKAEPVKPLQTYNLAVTMTGTVAIQATSLEEAIEKVKHLDENKFMWKEDWRETAKLNE